MSSRISISTAYILSDRLNPDKVCKFGGECDPVCMQLERRDVRIMLKRSLPARTRAAAQASVQARLEGRILTTMHGIQAPYQFHKFSDRTALSPFPECALLPTPPSTPLQPILFSPCKLERRHRNKSWFHVLELLFRCSFLSSMLLTQLEAQSQS